MVFYNQNDYAHVPYPSPTLPKATVKSGGCGAVAMSMIVENLLGVSFPPPVSAAFAIEHGARVVGGTDMFMLGRAITENFPLKYESTTSIDAALSALRYKKAMVAASAGRNNLFSNQGHIIVLAEVGNSFVTVLDPAIYPGKFTLVKYPIRKNVTVNGNLAYVRPDILATDCEKYYIFEVAGVTVDEAKRTIKQKAGLSDKTIEFLYNYRWGDDLLIKLAQAMKGA